jgi:hypothetical protein
MAAITATAPNPSAWTKALAGQQTPAEREAEIVAVLEELAAEMTWKAAISRKAA